MALKRLKTYMGWTFGDPGCETLRMTMHQDRMVVKVARKGAAVTAQYCDHDRRPISVVGYDSVGGWAAKPSGERLNLRDDLLEEFEATMRILSNHILDLTEQSFDPGDVVLKDVDATTLLSNNGARIDAFTSASGGLLGAMVRAGGRATSLVPMSAMMLPNGRRFITKWMRDEEPPIEVSHIRLGVHVFDAEVRRLFETPSH